MAVDWTKPLRTVEGHKARLLGDIRYGAPMVVAIEGGPANCEKVFAYYRDGSPEMPRQSRIINVPEDQCLHRSEMQNLAGNRIRRKGTQFTFLVLSSGPDSVVIFEGHEKKHIGPKAICRDFEWSDGSPIESKYDLPF